MDDAAKKTRPRNSGMFVKGNTIGKETRFNYNNTMSLKYDDKYCDMLIEFMRKPIYSTDSMGKVIISYPTFERFADSIDVTSGTLANWADKYPRFAKAYARARDLQRGMIIEGGMIGAYNHNVVKFVASCVYGMVDKQAVQLSGVDNDGKDAPFEVNVKITRD